jgi:hypothetical protein
MDLARQNRVKANAVLIEARDRAESERLRITASPAATPEVPPPKTMEELNQDPRHKSQQAMAESAPQPPPSLETQAWKPKLTVKRG